MIQFEQIFIFTKLEMKQLPLPIQPIWDVIVGYEFWFLLWIYCICTELTFDVYNNITYPWSLPLGNPPPLAIFMTLRVPWESARRLPLVSVSISSLSFYGRFFWRVFDRTIRPMVSIIRYFAGYASASKWLEHKTEYFEGPFHFFPDVFTKLIHWRKISGGSKGKIWRLTSSSLQVMQHPQATHV